MLTYRVPGLVQFARGLTTDLAAIRAALSLPCNNRAQDETIDRIKNEQFGFFEPNYTRSHFDNSNHHIDNPSPEYPISVNRSAINRVIKIAET